MITLKDLRIGSTIVVRGSWGSGPAVRAKVIMLERDIKNGRAGVDYTVERTGDEHWAYLDQVERVVQY